METYNSDNEETNAASNNEQFGEEPVQQPSEGAVLPPYSPAAPTEEFSEVLEYTSGEEPPPAPLERINPWMGIITQPRATMRYILDSGEWNNIWAVYAIVFALSIPTVIASIFMQPHQAGGAMGGAELAAMYGVMAGMLVFMLVLGYPLAMLMVYISGYFYKIAGGWLDGVGTTEELRIAFTWSYVISSYFNIIMLIPYGLIAFYNYTADSVTPAQEMLMSVVVMLLSIPASIISMIYMSKCIGEAHRFSAWRGFGTLLLGGLIWFGIIMGIGVGFALLFGVIGMLFS